MKIRASVAGALVVTGLGLAAWLIVRDTPQYAIFAVKRAIEQHDLTTFSRYVDHTSIAEQLIDDMAAEASRAAARESDTNLGIAIGQGLVGLLKPQLAEEIDKAIVRSVETGSFDGGGDDSGLLTRASRAEYRGIDSTEFDGKVAIVGVRLFLPSEGSEMVVKLNLRDVGRHWQIYGIANFLDLLSAEPTTASAATTTP